MQLTTETRRTRWLGLVLLWLALGAYLGWHAATIRQSVELLDVTGLRGAAVAPTPRQHIVPTLYADATMWVRNALDLAHGAGPQMRFTHADNAPYGREVHWNSGFAWAIATGGWARHLVTGEPLSTAIEHILPWFNAPVLLGFIILFTTWVARRAGLGAAVVIGLGMVGHDLFYDGFSPYYVDHHGLLAALVQGLVLGTLFMGVGFWRATDEAAQLLPGSAAAARRAAVFSAICGAFGMWISAATLIPAIAITGIAGAAGLFGFGRRSGEGDIHFDPSIWRTWGRVGAIGCLVLYLLEYAPAHLGFRLEVNHPAYALGWWGGSELIAQFGAWRCAARGTFRPRWGWLAAAVAAIATAPVIIAIGGARVFVVFDVFITQLSRHVSEGLSLPAAIHYMGAVPFRGAFAWMAAGLLAAVLALWQARRADRVVVATAIVAVAGFTAMAIGQIRWGASASGPQICLLLLALATVLGRRRLAVRWVTIAAVAAGLMLPFAFTRVMSVEAANRQHIADRMNGMQPIYRDLARVLRASQPQGPIVLLASPNGSVAMGYYGDFQTIGTLYWENLAGTKAAAEIFAAHTDDEARHRLRQRGVTHVAAISEDNFIAEYYGLLHPGASTNDVRQSFGYRLLVDQSVPLWLDPIPYQKPRDIPMSVDRILLFRTRFASPPAEAAFEAALREFSAGHAAAAGVKLDEALALAPDSAEFWAAKCNLRMAEGDVVGAYAAVQKATAVATRPQAFLICKVEGAKFYAARAPGAALQLYRAALQVNPDPMVQNNLAWILATAKDPGLRDGPEALRLAEALATQTREPLVLNGYAAALAECGRFDEAVKVATEVLAAARTEGQPNGITLAEQRLAAYRAHQPWRQ